jgi:hypothetical protein
MNIKKVAISFRLSKTTESVGNFGTRPQNCSPALSEVEQFLTNVGFKGRQIIILPYIKLLICLGRPRLSV